MPIDNFAAPHILIIGGGIVGLSCALNLRQRGLPVTLVAPGGMTGTASWGNAGHIAVEQVEPLASTGMIRSLPRRLFARGGPVSLPPGAIRHWLPFSLKLLAAARPSSFEHGKATLANALSHALPAWRRLLDTVGAPDLLVEDGHFVVWESAASARHGRAAAHRADTGTARVRDATPEEVAAIRDLVDAPVAGAVRFSGSGQIADPDALAGALESAFERLGGVRLDARVRELALIDGTASAILDSGETVSADMVVVAAGARSGALLGPIGHKVPLIAERGYHIQARQTDWPEAFPPVVFEDRSMIVTRFRGALRAASFVEFATPDTPPDPRKWDRLERHATALGLPLEQPVERWIGARPTLPDYLPAIGQSALASNLYYAFGHQHLGLTLGPVTGEALGALIDGEPGPLDLAPFDLDRFR
ncbi:MAG: FAD-binding oxidoreductase [Sphingomonas sp.]|jgi:D-amino-acid dehydrogenase|uniref:NAD(P)/FAD-dependent oxidoreductase n=1 Tax=Sphingomonas sp. TaxID=28214 RepID=UPI00356B2601